MEYQKMIDFIDDKTNQTSKFGKKLGWNKRWIMRKV